MLNWANKRPCRMKTNFREFSLGIGFMSLVLCVGCQGDQSKATGPPIATAAPSLALAPAEAGAEPAAPPAAKPAEGSVPVVKNEAPPAPAIPPGSIIITKATLANTAAGTNVVAPAPAG